MKPAKISILAPGLIGGSVALAATRAFPEASLFIWSRRQEALAPIQKALPKAKTGTDLPAAAGSDLILLAAPASALADLVRSLLPHLSGNTLVTDVASVKGSVEKELAPLLQGRARWIGSHPMAGSEESGFHAARADLFQNATVILTPTPSTAAQTTQDISTFWKALGARVVEVTAEEHDRQVARVSHLPHAVAATLVRVAGPKGLPFAGPGYRDTTRIAAGPTAMWTEILLGNREEILKGLQDFRGQLQDLEKALENRDAAALTKFLEDAAKIRRSLPSS
jgi:prephenate dehydrogenase